MQETEWSIDAPDGAKIYGVTNQAKSEPSRKAVLIANGLGCFHFSHPYSLAALHFLNANYDVVRFNSYDAREGARNILECSIETLVSDLDRVLSEQTKQYDKIFLVGHSYGGLVIMTANPAGVAAASLWDPSYNMSNHDWAKGITEDLPGDRVLTRWGGAYVSSKRMWEDEKRYDMPFCRTLSQKARFPVQVVHADKGVLYTYGESWHTYCPHPTDYHLLEGAGHNFEQLDSVPLLLDKCTAWFDRF